MSMIPLTKNPQIHIWRENKKSYVEKIRKN